MVSNKEISEMLAARRAGKHPKKNKSAERKVANKKCPECRTINKENAKFCVGCGKSFEEKSVEIKPKDIKKRQNTKICPSCKSEIPENAKFCVICGETQTPKEEPISEEKLIEPSKEHKKTFKLVIHELVLEKEGIKSDEKCVIEGLDDEIRFLKYGEIESINFIEESGLGTIEIMTNSNIIKIKGANPDFCSKFVSKAQEKISKANPEIETESMDKIKKAKELLDIGAINEEEFENIKMKILER